MFLYLLYPVDILGQLSVLLLIAFLFSEHISLFLFVCYRMFATSTNSLSVPPSNEGTCYRLTIIVQTSQSPLL